MTVKTIGLPSIILENEKTYQSYLIGLLDSIDTEGSLFINRSKDKISFRITPSHPQYLTSLFQGIKDIHTLFNIRVEFSKSIKASTNISYSISDL